MAFSFPAPARWRHRSVYGKRLRKSRTDFAAGSHENGGSSRMAAVALAA